MCKRCNYVQMLERSGLDPTPLRQAVLKSIGDHPGPLAAAEIMAAVQSQMSINKVTLYRILHLLVDRCLVRRLSAGDRAFRYGMGRTSHHPEHPHFVCSRCGVMECLGAAWLPEKLAEYEPGGKRLIRHIDVRFEGICESCLNKANGIQKI